MASATGGYAVTWVESSAGLVPAKRSLRRFHSRLDSLRKTGHPSCTCMIAAALIVDGWLLIGFAIKDVAARLGRPAIPVSVAGVARRTTWRTRAFVATLPAGRGTVVIEGVRVHQCGGRYYQLSGSQYFVVHVD